jgi:hypothetical protein
MTFGRFFGRFVRLSFDSRSEERSFSSTRRASATTIRTRRASGRGEDKRTDDNASCDRRSARGHQFKRPREYRFVEALPKNNYGKLLKIGPRWLLADAEPG